MKVTEAMGMGFMGAGGGLFIAILFPYRIILIPLAIGVVVFGFLFLKGYLDFYNIDKTEVRE